MKKNDELDQGFIISTVLNVFFMLGLIFIMRLENLFILIPYVLIMMVNAIYLVTKSMKVRDNQRN
ncbi:hypothetical protein [Staphylococcus epidermidis]|uniref:hypothetical protein n=1 Tax=Staphylococcus epidermidis TaxID=1282 RepID=UPI0018797F02|nr:hypothetical protein [Staphylococcus epidermidis]MBE7304044.1 hypothetical protein [Staphylococcus epidermidis]MCG1162624.1 hypothetical protein [Staphylococcus epidermidis]MCG1439443.1 hypothetical protein [Staphylococcus epidermidis]MCG1753208.1 hypothetical protein [Staphylococcus epidermidis]MCG1838025.1 hypothetical protein [Staphylococcus epidermidis]